MTKCMNYGYDDMTPALPPRHFSTATPSTNASLLASLVLLHLSPSTISDLQTMSHARYERIPTDPNAAHDHDLDQDSDRPLRASVQAEFNRQPPAWWKRGLLLIALFGLGWLAIKLSTGNSKPQVIYATRSVTLHIPTKKKLTCRYSEEFKYRPAASPVITETLKDGRLRIRGASVGALGVREEDIPETPAEKKAKEEKRRKEAREAAKAKLGLKPRKAGKGKKSKKSKSKNEY